MKKNLTILLPLLAIVYLAGCGDPKVTGKVTFPDGTPLTVGQVMFQKEGFIASGDIKKDGTYSAGKAKDGDGLPPGTYKVFINGASTYDAAELAEIQEQSANSGGAPVFRTPRPINLIATKFESAGTSDLTVEVKGNTKYDITVEPPN